MHRMEVLQKSSGSCLKRKLADDCLTEHSKSHHVEVENVSSELERRSLSDPHAHRCCIQPNLANDCINYLRSTIPTRVVFYKGGSWCNFPDQILPFLVDAFKNEKSSVVIVMEDQPLLVDFLSMTLVNLRTKKQRSVAWHDCEGKWFIPSSFFDEEVGESTKSDMNAVEGSTRKITGDKIVNSPSESLKQVVLGNIPLVQQSSCAADKLRNILVSVERGSESFMFAQNLFLSGMGSFATTNKIINIHRYSPKHITAQCRLEAFEKQIGLTSERCGAANVRYGWLGSKKKDILRILMDGFVRIETTDNVDLSPGIYLSSQDRAFTSVGLCDVDENGVQYMLLCRAILGNMGSIKPGSHEFPSSNLYDSVADNHSNPGCYMIWNSNVSTHICLEYLISFRVASNVQEYLGEKGLQLFHLRPKQGLVDLCTLQPILCQAIEGPTSPWVSFKDLFAMIQKSLSPVARELLFHHYEELKENKITREEMVKKMILIVGQKLLVDSLKKLDKCSPSLWYKSPAKATTDTTNATVHSVCVGASKISPSATPGYDYLSPGIVPMKCEPIDSHCGSCPLPSVTLKQKVPSLRMSSQKSSTHCPESNDPSVPVAVHTVQASISIGVPENIDFLRTGNCDSVGPSLVTNHHACPTQNSASVRRSSLISTLGKSESLGMKHSFTPVIASKVPDLLPTGLLPGNPLNPNAKGSDAATSNILPQIQPPSMLRQPCLRSMAPHLHVPTMSPQLRVPSKASQVNVHDVKLHAFKKIVMLQAQYSGAMTMDPVSSAPPSASEAPKGCAPPTSSEAPMHHQSPEVGTRAKSIGCAAPSMAWKSPDTTANFTAEGHTDSTLTSAVSAFQCGTSNNISIAADVLVGLSSQLREVQVEEHQFSLCDPFLQR